MSSPIAVVMTGRGGQGGKLAMELLAWSASADGLVPVLYSVYGALIRGGDIASFLAAGATSPGVAQRDSYDVMCALHNNWFDRYYALLRPGGVLVADASCITASMRNRGDVTNLVAAGAVAALSQIATPAALEQGMNAVVPPHRADRPDRRQSCGRPCGLRLGRERAESTDMSSARRLSALAHF